MPPENIEVFISYRWKTPSVEIANEIYSVLSTDPHRFVVRKDDKDVDYKGDLGAYMERLGDGKFVVVILSDGYLKSRHCMKELVMLQAKQDFHRRIFPIVLEDAGIRDAVGQLDYRLHWEAEKEKLNAKLALVKDKTGMETIFAELTLYDRIQDSILNIMITLNNMNTLSRGALQVDGYAIIANQIKKEAARLALIEQERLKKEIQPAGQPMLREIYKYACDRIPQMAAVMKGIRPDYKPPRFFFVYGEQSESHEGLGNRIKMELEGEFLRNIKKDMNCILDVIEYPEAAEENYDTDRLLNTIFDNYKVDPGLKISIRDQRFGDLLKQSPITHPSHNLHLVILQILIYDYDFHSEDTVKVISWMNTHFFDRSLFGEGSPEVIVLWSVVATKQGKNMPPVRPILETFTSTHADWMLMPDLKPIEQQHIKSWVGKYHATLSAEKQDLLIQQHFEAQLPMKMETVEEILDRLIENYNTKKH